MGLTFTYPTLVSAIQQYTLEGQSLANTDFSAFLPTIIQLSEERIIRDLNSNIFDVEFSGNVSVGNPYIGIPLSYLGIRSMRLSSNIGGTFVPLIRKDITWVENYWRTSSNLGTPVYYAVDGDGGFDGATNFILAPTPDIAYPYTLRYIQRPPSMTATNPETWLGNHAADCLLYACLAESMAYLREDLASEAGMTAMFESKYARELVKLKQELSNQIITGFYF